MKNSVETPKFSIITVVLNREEDIEYTLKSITQQTYKNLEYIVIDGASTDDTLKKIELYRDRVDVLLSEKDNGIYEAMNKGLELAQGDYVLFVNGGDSLHDITTLENIVKKTFKSENHQPDIIYGECMLVHKNRSPIGLRSKFKNQIFPESLNYYSFKNGTSVSHQSFIVKREITLPYDLSYQWSSDIDWMLNCIKKSNVISRYNGVISDFVFGDTSEEQKLASLKERFAIMQKHYGFINNLWFHIQIAFKKVISIFTSNKQIRI